jgi:hypothetical protein
MEEEINISVKWGAKNFTFKIGNSKTLLDLRVELQKLTGVPLDLQKLMFKGCLIIGV